jgi:pimeloyl-ACP methyl ester carboxylesterase
MSTVGTPAVLWHSLFVDLTSWVRLRRRLAAVRRLILIDGPGQGPNPAPPGRFSLDDCAAAAVEVLDALDVARPVDWLGNAWAATSGCASRPPTRMRAAACSPSPHRSSPCLRPTGDPCDWSTSCTG